MSRRSPAPVVETRAPSPPGGNPLLRGWAPSLVAWALAGLAGAATVLVHHPWQWSLIDDPVKVQALQHQIALHGHVPGVLHRIAECAQADWDSGLFRPSFWVYESTFYLLGPTPARAVRAFLVGLALAVPLMMIARRVRGSLPYRLAFLAWAAAVLASNTWLWDNISWASLHELPGIALVALGLSARHTAARIGTWTVAAGFKAPFAWLLCVWGIALWRQGRRTPAVAALSAGIGTLATAAVFSRRGSYTAQASTSPAALLAQARIEWAALWPMLTVLLIGAFLLGVNLPEVLPPRGLPALLGLGGLLYAANLLVWKAGGYYAVAPAWLLGTAGTLIATRSVRRQSPAGFRRVAAAALAVAIGGYTVAAPSLVSGLRRQIQRDDTVAGIVEFATQVPPNTLIGINGGEAASQFEQILDLNGHGGRRVRFATVGPDRPAPAPMPYYVQLADQGAGDPALMGQLVRSLPRGAIYRVVPGDGAA